MLNCKRYRNFIDDEDEEVEVLDFEDRDWLEESVILIAE